MIRLYSVIPHYAILQNYIENIFFVFTFSKYGVRGKRRVKVSPCDSITLSLYKNVIIWQEENTFYIKQCEKNENTHQMILSFNNRHFYEKVYMGNIEEVAILFKEGSAIERFVKIEQVSSGFISKVKFHQNSEKILNSLFSIKGYKNRRPFIEAVLLEQLKYSFLILA